MEITQQEEDGVLVVKLVGRLDATWSRHVGETVSGHIREGAHRIHLDMNEVDYISSAGIGILLHIYKELQSVSGEFAIPKYSEAVRNVIDLAGLATILTGAALPTSTMGAAKKPESRKLERPASEYQVFDLGDPPIMRGRLVGDPSKFRNGGFGPEDCVREKFPEGSLGLGLGAFGEGWEDCRERFGEFLSVSGSAAYLPSDASQTPDYITHEGALVPEVNILYGLSLHGKFRHMAAFQCKSAEERVGLREVADACLEISGGTSAAVVIVAETASLVGAALQRSPGLAEGQSPFSFPGVRDWFSFTVERAYSGSVVLAVGIVSRDPGTLAPMMRPLKSGDELQGHFHGGAFTYRPLRKGKLELPAEIQKLFETQNLLGVLHLLSDDRDLTGVGESEFIRGACWVSPVEVRT